MEENKRTTSADTGGQDSLMGKGVSRREFLQFAGVAGAVVGLGGLSGLASACGGTATPPAATTSASAGNTGGGLAALPADIQKDYLLLGELAQTGPSPYANFKAKNPPPWLIGYASSYAGNTWRIGARTRLTEYLMPRYKEAGLLKDVITTESNLNDTVQIQQIRQLVDQGCDAIITAAPSTTALNSAIKYAYDRGVVFCAEDGYVSTPNAVSVTGNYARDAKAQAETLAKDMGEKGDVLIVQGIPGATASELMRVGHELGLKEFPNIKIVGTVAGNWTDQIAKTEVLKFLSTHPGGLGGIAVQAPGDMGTLSALLSSGQRVCPITPGGELGPLAYWGANPNWISATYPYWPPGSEFQMGWEAMFRTLEGQGPLIATLVSAQATPLTHADLATYVPSGTQYNNDTWQEYEPGTWFTKERMDNFFARPADPATYKA